MSHPASPQTKGFFASLFDFTFQSFVTIRFIRVIYAVVVTLICAGGLLFVVTLAAAGGAAAALGILVVPAIVLLYLVIVRVGLELVAVIFRIGENTSALVERSGGPGREPIRQEPSAWAPPPQHRPE